MARTGCRPSGYDPRNRPWYRRASEIGTISFTTPYIDLVTNKLVIALVKPLVVDGRIVGVMGADTVLDSLVQNVLNFKVSETGYGFIVERNGTILVHPNQQYVMREKLQNIERDLGRQAGSVYQRQSRNRYLPRQRPAKSRTQLMSDCQFRLVHVRHRPPRRGVFPHPQDDHDFCDGSGAQGVGILALIALVVVSGSGLVLFFFSKRYSTAIQQHQEELTGINKDLEWNIIKRKEVETYYQTCSMLPMTRY